MAEFLNRPCLEMTVVDLTCLNPVPSVYQVWKCPEREREARVGGCQWEGSRICAKVKAETGHGDTSGSQGCWNVGLVLEA